MLTRCLDENTPYYRNYGGRGIAVCERWRDFQSFYEDMGTCPPKHSLDRINNDLGYFKENCRWTTRSIQNRNRRGNVLVTFNGETLTVQDWAEKTSLTRAALVARLDKGWPLEKALTQPFSPHIRHGRYVGAKSPEYVSWQSMLARCRDPRFKDYAGRGITVCERWKKFENFLADMGTRPPGMTLDRIDPNGNYEKANCRWTTRAEQNRTNRRPKTIKR